MSEKVICIKTCISKHGHVSAIKGRIYSLLGKYYCSCGNFALDVGFKVQGAPILTYCSECGADHYFYEIWYLPKANFRSVDWNDVSEELAAEAMISKPEVETIKTEI